MPAVVPTGPVRAKPAAPSPFERLSDENPAPQTNPTESLDAALLDEKKLQGAMSFCTLAFISVAAVYALSTFGDQVPSLPPSRSLSRSLHPVQPPCNPVCLRHSGSSGQPCVPLA